MTFPQLPPVEERAALRRKYMWTQQEVAAELGVSRETISRWEKGTQEPTGLKGRRYAKTLARWSDVEP